MCIRDRLKQYTECEVHVVVTDSGRLTASYEEPELFDRALALADNVHSNASLGESIASGTFKTEGMVIIPCSMKTVAGIASGYSDNLLPVSYTHLDVYKRQGFAPVQHGPH